MTGILRLWCVACTSAVPTSLPEHELAMRVRELASRTALAARYADTLEFVRSFGFESGSDDWGRSPDDDLDALHARLVGGGAAGCELLWLASPRRIAALVASTLALTEAQGERLEPRPFTLTVVDHTPPKGPQTRPSLVGFELDWLPPTSAGIGGFPGATPRK